jgi:hypothetical protein
MCFPQWTTRRAAMFLTVSAVLIWIECWVWTKPTLRLEAEIGPGPRSAMKISAELKPRAEPISLPAGNSMNDDAKYFPPASELPWANTQAGSARAGSAPGRP